MILVFAIDLALLPVSGAGVGAGDFLRHLVLPAITLGSGLAAILTRMVRTSMLEELGQDYIRTARAKGLSENVVVYRHALRNALNPVLTVIGLQVWVAARRGDCYRDDLWLAGNWAADAVGDFESRLCAGAGLHSGDWAIVCGGESGDGFGVCAG